ncbi:MAG: hypothetical protein K2X81_23180 [Candidatus Obscuribacterales bacterium]|nr:hypothetical protein [Candidatus Obscuribacterales bacterium]
MLQNQSPNGQIRWHQGRHAQTQRQQAEELIDLPRKVLANQISIQCNRRGFIVNGKDDDSAITIIAGNAEVKCKLNPETQSKTKLTVSTDYYAPQVVKVCAYAGWALATVGAFALHNSNLQTLGMVMFFGAVIFIEIQKVRALKGIEEFKQCLQDAIKN